MISINIERGLLEKLRNEYPTGTRIRLMEMKDPVAPVPPGTAGTVIAVDDVGTIHMKWDNGRTLGLITGVLRKTTAILTYGMLGFFTLLFRLKGKRNEKGIKK